MWAQHAMAGFLPVACYPCHAGDFLKDSDRRWPSEAWRLRRLLRQMIGRPAVGARRAFNAFLRPFSNDALSSTQTGSAALCKAGGRRSGRLWRLTRIRRRKFNYFCKKCGKTDGGKFDK